MADAAFVSAFVHDLQGLLGEAVVLPGSPADLVAGDGRHGVVDPADDQRRAAGEAIVLAFYLKPGQNISEMGKAVTEMLSTASDTFLPKDIRVEKVSNKPEIVDKKIEEVVDNLNDSVLIVLGVLVLLSGFRVALESCLARASNRPTVIPRARALTSGSV